MLYLIALFHAGLLLILITNLIYLRRRRRRTVPITYPSVSILIPARNEEHNLRRLLPSLLIQHYPSFEIIVYDDGSEDRTWDVINEFNDDRITALQGSSPPEGWVGKVHALYQATRKATGSVYLFLDADAVLHDEDALKRLTERYLTLPPATVMTGLVHLRGGGPLLVSLVPNAMLLGLPWALVRPLPFTSLGALNGQCWMLDAGHYHRLEPHEQVKDEVLEDVVIGRLLKKNGIIPALVPVDNEVAVYMYRDHTDAWNGFRKNAYLIMGGTPLWFIVWAVFYFIVYVLAPFVWPGYLISLYLFKALTDRLTGFPLWTTLFAPLSYGLGMLLQFDSAYRHWTGRVSWKGRKVR